MLSETDLDQDCLEVRRRDLAEPIRQGDVFEWLPKYTESPWQRLSVVVTADCDIALEKHQGLLQYCPILTYTDFLCEFWLKDEIRRQTEYYERQIAQTVSQMDVGSEGPEYGEGVSAKVVRGWYERRGIDGILEDVGSSKENGALTNQLGIYETVCKAENTPNLGTKLRAIACAKLGKQDPVEDEVAARVGKIWNSLKSRFASPPGDLFLLSCIPGDNAAGYVAYLRSIREIRVERIAIRPREERSDASVRAARIGRVKEPYRYRLTQRLASVFSDIGLPDKYRSASLEAVDELKEQSRKIFGGVANDE